MSKARRACGRFMVWLWLAAILFVGYCYVTHPIRPYQAARAWAKWRDVVAQIAAPKENPAKNH